MCVRCVCVYVCVRCVCVCVCKQGFRSRSPLSPLARTQIIWRLLGASKSQVGLPAYLAFYDGARAASTRFMCTYNIIIQVVNGGEY